MITRKYIKWRKNNTTYQTHLHTAKLSGRSKHICVRKNNITYYAPLYTATSSSRLCVNVGGTSYYAPDETPVVDITYVCKQDAIPYQKPFVLSGLTLNINSAINSDTELQVYDSSWVTVLKLPAASTSASLASSVRINSPSWRLKVTCTVSPSGQIVTNVFTSEFTATANNKSQTKRIAIPEQYWGSV